MTYKNYLLLMLAVVALFSGCNPDNKEEYTGINTVYLEADKDPVLTIGEGGSIAIKLKTVQKAIRDTRFVFSIKPLEGANIACVKVKEPEIVLVKGEREVTFHVVSVSGVLPNTDMSQYELSISQMPDEKMELNSPLRFRLLNVVVPPLTENQKKLLEGYKAKGMDLSPFLGKVNVKATVQVPAGGLIKDFEKPWEKSYESFSVITLSDKSTPGTPVLKMLYNPMGMNEFFYFALRKNTIENYEFWYDENAGPLFKEIMELIKWNDKSVEQFSVVLDNLRIIDTKRIDYLGKVVNISDETITCVPFKYEYSAWNRQKKLIDENNAKAVECNEGGATANPDNFLNTTDVVNDAFEDGKALPVAKGEWIVSEKKIRFFFLTSVENAGWYITVTAEYFGR